MFVRINSDNKLKKHDAIDLGLKHTRISTDVYEVIDRNLFLVSVMKHEIDVSPYESTKHIRIMEWNKYNGSSMKIGLELGAFREHYYVIDEKKFLLAILEHGIEFEEVEELKNIKYGI